MMSEEGEIKKSPEEIRAELDRMMARAAIKHAVSCFVKACYEEPPKELLSYWQSLDTPQWKRHLNIFTKELKTYNQVVVKKLLFDLDYYIKDCRKLVPGFSRTKEEILLMVAIGQIEIEQFLGNLTNLPSNREKLDRQIHRQIKELDWQDNLALIKLDELNQKLDQPRIKKSEIENIEEEIKLIEEEINSRKSKRDQLAIKLVEWKARGNIDIASPDNNFRLDA